MTKTYAYKKDALRAIRRQGLNPADFRIVNVHAPIPKKHNLYASRFQIEKPTPVVPEITIEIKSVLEPIIDRQFSQAEQFYKSAGKDDEVIRLQDRQWEFKDRWNEANSPQDIFDLVKQWFSLTTSSADSILSIIKTRHTKP